MGGSLRMTDNETEQVKQGILDKTTNDDLLEVLLFSPGL